MSGSDDARALRVMIDALRAEEPPSFEWDAVERQLLARLDGQADAAPRAEVAAARPSNGNAFARSMGFAAAAAAITLGVQIGSRPAPAARAEPKRAPITIASVPAATEAGVHDASALRVGDIVETHVETATFALAGTVRWTLAPESRIVVRAQPDPDAHGIGHVVTLERGSIHADVVPRDGSEGLVESFAVEAAGTRVAVHGTAFSVVLEPRGIVVDVEHGAVAVGPTGHVGITTGRLLVGPSRASFSLDGGRWSHLMAREAPRVELVAAAPVAPPAPEPAQGEPPRSEPAIAAPGAVAVAAPLAPASAPEAASALEPAPEAAPAPAEPPQLTEAAIRAGLQRCFASTYDTAPSVHLSISTTFRLTLKSDGSVVSARLTPPLKPEFMQCAGALIGGRRFADGRRDVAIPMTFGTR